MNHDQIMRARLCALIDRSGRSIPQVAKGIGVHHTTLYRKLHDVGNRRSLVPSDIDAILAELGMPADAVAVPVLFAGDVSALRWIHDTAPTIKQAEAKYPDDRIQRLIDQALITQAGKRYRLTAMGRQAA